MRHAFHIDTLTFSVDLFGEQGGDPKEHENGNSSEVPHQ